MTTSTTPRFPNVHVQLSGTDGNVFALIGRVGRAMAQAGATQQEISDFITEVMSAGSYDAALITILRWVDVS